MTGYMFVLRHPKLRENDITLYYADITWGRARYVADVHRAGGYTVRIKRLPKDYVPSKPDKPLSDETRAKIREMWLTVNTTKESDGAHLGRGQRP